ncbi:hypothetical protein [Streptomyces hydrogenans]|uniref:hypothetical protein n=1 Tax=Streptomyces hydrogenans TaxID=1873719 RepID=UPI0036E68D9F
MRTRVSGLGLGPIGGDYALMTPFAGTLLQILRCYLLTEGVAVTNRFGRVTDSVAWSDVTGIQQTTVVDLYMGAHRMEIHRNQSATPLTFLAPGVKSRLVEALLTEGRRAGALQ